jgi:hypothetical protein
MTVAAGLSNSRVNSSMGVTSLANANLGDILAIAKQLRELNRNDAEQSQCQYWCDEPSPALRPVAIRPGNHPHVTYRDEPCNRRLFACEACRRKSYCNSMAFDV